MRRLFCIIAWMLLALPASADKWALLIGIDDYEDRNHISSLSGAARDARQFRKTLVEVMGVQDSHIQLLVADKNRDNDESLPTRANISQALSRLKQNAKAGDTVYVFFSGHGIRVATKDYLLPYDFKGLDAESGIDTAYEEDKFYERLSQVPAAAIVLVWDKCRNDPFGKTRNGAPQRNNLTNSQANKSWNIVRDAGTPPLPTLIKLFACSPGQCSYEWTDKGQGYFTYFLERGLRGAAADGKGQITVKSLKDYLLKEVATRVKQNENAQQTPHATLDGTSPEDLVLAMAGKTVVAKTPEPVRPTPKPAPKNSTPVTPVKKTPPSDPPPANTNLPLPQRILQAHRWDTLQKVSSVRYSGTVKITGTDLDPETWSGYNVTITSSGKFQGSWKSSDPTVENQEASGDPQTLTIKVNGEIIPPLPEENVKPIGFPQAMLNMVLSGLQSNPNDWTRATGGGDPTLTLVSNDSGVGITLTATFDANTSLLKRIKMVGSALGVISIHHQYDFTNYQNSQGIPLPRGIQVTIVNAGENTTEKAVHTYSTVGINR